MPEKRNSYLKRKRKMNESGSVFIRLTYFVMFIMGLWLVLAIVNPFYDEINPLLDNTAFGVYGVLLKAVVVLIIPAFVIWGIMFIFTAPARPRQDDYV